MTSVLLAFKHLFKDHSLRSYTLISLRELKIKRKEVIQIVYVNSIHDKRWHRSRKHAILQTPFTENDRITVLKVIRTKISLL